MARGLRPAALLLALVAGPAAAQEAVPEVDYLLVRKAQRVLDAYSEGHLVRRIEGIQLGDAPAGPKRFEGDERTPEGRYIIDFGNPDSAYHLSLHISYPSDADLRLASAQGRSAGGAIFIHGQPNGHPGRAEGDWTDGCIAVSNDEIEWLWQAVPDGVTIEILS